ncbi:MAG TPA: NAD-dependent epimerase/dehydratase family protein [Candidatus Paceibacterota bacterium]
MNIFVTGAGGFIGKVLTKHLLDRGYIVSALVRKPTDISFCHANLHWYVGDIRNSDFLKKSLVGTEIVIHLAAAKSDEDDSYEINVTGTRNILTACQQNNIRGIINVSTISTKFARKGLYGTTKQKADAVLKDGHVPVVIIKPSVVYGDDESGILGSLIRYTKLPIVPVIGTGLFKLRPIHVSDVATAIEKILSQPFSGQYTIFDLGGPDNISFNDLVMLVGEKLHNKRVFLLHIPVSVGLVIARVLGFLLKKPPLSTSNVIATNQEAEIEHESFWKTYNFHPRTLKQGLDELKTESQSRAKESHALLSYIAGGKRIDPGQEKLFEQAIIFYKLHNYSISSFILVSKRRIGALDAITKLVYPSGVFQRKLLIGAALIECSPISSEVLLPREIGIIRLFMRLAALTCLSFGKLVYGSFLLCIPHVYKNNV